jgi:hypothetical protein
VTAIKLETTEAEREAIAEYGADAFPARCARDIATLQAALSEAEKAGGLALTERDWPEDFELENGNYVRRCLTCSHTFFGHKRRVVCKTCAAAAPPQDGLREALAALEERYRADAAKHRAEESTIIADPRYGDSVDDMREADFHGLEAEVLSRIAEDLRAALAPGEGKGTADPDAIADRLIEYPDGSAAMLMFHWALENTSYDEIAQWAGFETQYLWMRDDLPESDSRIQRHEAGECVFTDWRPTPPDGWKLAALYEGEDGPCAMFVRRPAATRQATGGAR